MSCTQLIGNPIQSYQWPGLLTSGTGNPACAPLPCFSVIDLGEQLTITELSSWLSHGLWQHSQEWLCHKDQIRQPVAQAILPVRLCLASGLSISRGTAYNCRAFLRAESWLVAAQPGMAVPQRPNLRVAVKADRPAEFA